MLVVISPAKSIVSQPLIPKEKTFNLQFSIPFFFNEIKDLIFDLKKFSISDLEKLMKISYKLAEINYQRFQNFRLPINETNSKPALFLFDGDVYRAMQIDHYSLSDLQFAQDNLRILSGLYGLLKPLDLIQPYRLEMGTKFKDFSKRINGKIINDNFVNLSQFWQARIFHLLNLDINSSINNSTLINLASDEYFSAIDLAKVKGNIINIVFKEKKGGQYKNIGIFAKRARGLMTNFIIKNQIIKPEHLKSFNVDGYCFRSEFSQEKGRIWNWCFCCER